MSHKPYQSSLAKLIPKQIDPEKVKQDGWKDNGILVVSADDTRLSWPEREIITQIAIRLYGERNQERYRT